MKRSHGDGGGQKKKRKVAFASNRDLASDLLPERKKRTTIEQEAQRTTAANAMRSAAPLSTDPGLGSVLAGLGGAAAAASSTAGAAVAMGSVSSVLTNDELIDMEKSGDLDVLKRYKQEQADDMDRLSFLESAKTRVYEKDRERTRKNDELDDIFGDEEEGDEDMQEAEGREDEEEEGEVEEFDTKEEERSDYFTDTNIIGQFRDERKEERKSAVKDHWYFEHMQKKEAEDHDGSRAIERMQQKRPQREQPKEDGFRKKYESVPDVELFRALLSYLMDGENVASAVRRLGGASETKKRSWKNRNRAKKSGDESGDASDAIGAAEKQKSLKQMEELTTLAELCMEKGFASIYSRSRNWILREIGRLSGVGSGNSIDAGDAAWEYQAADGSGGVFGPYTAHQMSQWQQAGYFTDESPLAVRLVGEEDWRSSAMVDFDAIAKRSI